MKNDKNIRIFAYMGPIPENWNEFREPDYRNDNYINDEQYGYLKDGGWTGVIALMERTPEHTEAALTLSDKYGLDYYVRDEINWDLNYDPAIFERKADFYRKCEAHPSFAGIFITDEPDVSQYPVFAELKVSFDKFFNSLKHGYYINLLPTYANDVTQLGAPYPVYIDEYIKQVKPDNVCFDHYPFQKRRINPETEADGFYDYTRTDYFYNLDVVAKACDEADIEMWTFVQAKNYTRRETDLTYEAMAFQFYVSLAYGAKSLVYYTYWTWPGYYANEVDIEYPGSVISAKGVPLERYYHCKEIHAEISAFGEEFMLCKHKTTYLVPNGKDDVYFTKVEVKETPSFKGSATTLVGEFVHADGRKAYMVVNAVDPYAPKTDVVTCNLGGCTVYDRKEKFVKNGEFTVELKPGQGVFIIADEK